MIHELTFRGDVDVLAPCGCYVALVVEGNSQDLEAHVQHLTTCYKHKHIQELDADRMFRYLVDKITSDKDSWILNALWICDRQGVPLLTCIERFLKEVSA